MKIWASHYTLRSRSSLSARAVSQERHGCLLKIEKSDAVGYADLHPWEELGDASLNAQLKSLADDQPTALASRSLALAELDQHFRKKEKSAFIGWNLPANHFLINDLREVSDESLSDIWQKGFRSLKLKVGRDVQAELDLMLTHAFALSAFRLRLDFNASLSANEFVSFVGALPEPIHDAIEFVEDPTKWSRQKWQELYDRTSVCLALDRENSLDEKVDKESVQAVIVKPAVQDPLRVSEWACSRGIKIFMTSYLDHPVGQMGAMLEAACLSETFSIGDCGLASHFSYEPNAFSELLRMEGSAIQPPEGCGIGFDKLLEKQNWKTVR